MKKTQILFALMVCLTPLISSCIDCADCVRSRITTINGVVSSTSSQSPFEVCGRQEINAMEGSVTTTTVQGDRTTVSTWTTVCN